uniref:Uncharacterized protein n=1 Tax=Coccidioides posadasii RMSCC 3488 TaxID=454284 RepID=A0A0J6F549_COCPO|nr:hypothetical protein CPAG_00441 [Coccidioides posadasii RMSCC 3488]
MAAPSPLQRASAAQMLVKLFNGKGLTTPACLLKPIRIYDPWNSRIVGLP